MSDIKNPLFFAQNAIQRSIKYVTKHKKHIFWIVNIEIKAKIIEQQKEISPKVAI